MEQSNTNYLQNSAKIYTGSAGGELYITTAGSKQTITATNNKALYYSELAKKYRDEAKEHRDNAKFYAEQNSDVTVESVNNMRAELLREIDKKQDIGDYALKSDIPQSLSQLENDSSYATTSDLETFLPEQENNSYKFLMTNGENLDWQSVNSFNLFDTKLTDHILEGKEALGWELQGTYATNSVYPTFYSKCLEEKNSATATKVTLDDKTITLYSATNGHRYYDISEKSVADYWFDKTGMFWWYGVDTENERIFLPRNIWFEQPSTQTSEVNQNVYAGLPNITGQVTETLFGSQEVVSTGALSEGTVSGVVGRGDSATKPRSIAFDASKANSIYGNSDTVQPKAVKKLLYICVGNTNIVESITKVTEVTTSENDTLPLFTSQYFDFTPNNVSWLKAGGQAVSGEIYTCAYNELVNELAISKYGLKVINMADMISGVDYSEYWKINQDEMSFVCPTKISNNSLSNNQLYFKVANAVQNLELLNAGEVLESLSEKIGQSDCPAYIIKTYQNETSGYNIFSNGYCKQWGQSVNSQSAGTSTITFLKSFKDTNYNLQLGKNRYTGNNYSPQWVSRSESGFELYWTSQYTDWEACGYLAEGEY